LKLTSSSKLLNKMMTTGTFTHIFHPNNEKCLKMHPLILLFLDIAKAISLKKR